MILVSFIITIIMGSTFYFSYTTPYVLNYTQGGGFHTFNKGVYFKN